MALVKLLFAFLFLTDARIILREPRASPKALSSPLKSLLSKPAPKDPKAAPKTAIKPPPIKPPPKKEVVAEEAPIEIIDAFYPDEVSSEDLLLEDLPLEDESLEILDAMSPDEVSLDALSIEDSSSDAVSSDTLSADAVSSESGSSEAVSSEADPYDAVSVDAVSADSVSPDAVSSDAVSTDAMPSDAVSVDDVSADAVFSDAVSSDAVSSDAVSSDDLPLEDSPSDDISDDISDDLSDDDLSADVTYCYGDADCDRDEYCSLTEHICVEEPSTCYDDDECPGAQTCDVNIYQCIEPTPSPTSTGCCAGDSKLAASRCNLKESAAACSRMSSCYWIETDDESQCEWSDPTDDPYEAGCCTIADTSDLSTLWTEKCTEYGTMYDCLLPTTEYGISRCQWTSAPEDFDCSEIWPTPSPEVGCCAGTSGVVTSRCMLEEESSRCERMSDCHWISGDDADCEWRTTARPYEPGCCQIIYDTPVTQESGWVDLCRTFWNADDCTSPRSADNYARCYWTPTEEDYDCGDLWPTTTAEPLGCCAGDTMKSSDRCMSTDAKPLCDRMSDCHWIEGEYADCSPPSSTLEPPPDPGCCYIADDSLLGTRWEVICIEMWTESDCLRWTDEYGTKCQWSSQSEAYDCSVLWPTTNPTESNEYEMGCCAADNVRNVEFCGNVENEMICQRMASCHWLNTEDLSDCDVDDEYEPGCCTMSPYEDNALIWKEQCRTLWNAIDCAKPQDENGMNRCIWTPTEDTYDCATMWTTTSTTTTTTSPGCCAPDNLEVAPMCLNTVDHIHCDRMSSCHWIDTEDPTECQPPTTTNGPGCCLMFDQRPKAYEEGWNAKCTAYWNEEDCQRPMTADGYNRCYWTPTDEYTDCEQLWPSEQPTPSPSDIITQIPTTNTPTTSTTESTESTAPAPGCCASNDEYSVDQCTAALVEEDCNRLSSCYWIETEQYDDCIFQPPEPPETTVEVTPGCCVPTGDSIYDTVSLMQCASQNEEEQCLGLLDDYGQHRCDWISTEDNYDCSQLWPTPVPTTSTTATTLNPSVSPTETITIPPAPGCCAGDSYGNSRSCNGITDEMECGRTSSCHWIETEDAEDCSFKTTEEVIQPGCCMIAGDDPDFSNRWIYKCIALWSERECLMPVDEYDAYRCQWIETPNDFDCSELWPTEPPPPGCCATYSADPDAYTRCIGSEDKGTCDRMSDCHWILTEDYSQCDRPETTTDEPPPPGCCQVIQSDSSTDSYDDSIWTERCRELWTQETCENEMGSDSYSSKCFWTETSTDYDCSQLWPTTTTYSPGCCQATTKYAVERCSMITEQEGGQNECSRMSDCYWIDGEDANCEWITSSTTPPDPYEPGCCYIVSEYYIGTRWESICKDMWTEESCYTFKDEEGISYCEWMGAPEDYDCSNIWPTPSPITEQGCCAGETAVSTLRCGEKESVWDCSRMSDCYWIEGEYADCTFESTSTTPPEPGCCMIADGSSSNNPWIEKCTEYWTEDDCITPTLDGYSPRCKWTPTPEDFDCSGIWPTLQPTMEPVPGCCAADSQWATERCNETEEKLECDRMSSCHWIETADNSDCDWLTTNDPIEPGCCYVADASDVDSRWQELCTAFWSEERCLSASVCQWEPTDDYVDCEQLYPTAPPSMSTTMTTGGCCAGDSADATMLCQDRESEETCDRYSMCHWIGGEDADCEWKTTETVTEPGCCALNSYSDSTDLWADKCALFWNEKDCILPEDASGMGRCMWTPTDGYTDCEEVVPPESTTESTTEAPEPPEPGCCAGIDRNTNIQCVVMETKEICERNTLCYWNSGEDADCSWESTTPPYEPGCCVLANEDNLGTRWEVMCTEFYAEFDCLKPVDADYAHRCEWIETPSDYDCSHLWPTRAPEGCCAGDSYLNTAPCQAANDKNHCQRMSSCFWIETLDPSDCEWGTTETPGEPGCCYIASPGDLGSEWEDKCTSYWAEGDCQSLQDGYGTNKCEWQSTGHYFDCSLLWPTPVPEEGCCSGEGQCADALRMRDCQRMSSCHWMDTGDPADCGVDDIYEPGCCDVAGYFNPMNGWTDICRNYWNKDDCAGPVGSDGVARCRWTPTSDYFDCESVWSTPAPEPGCCTGDSYGSTSACNLKEDITTCERMSSCHWIYGEYADCSWVTTTAEPGCCAGDSANAADLCVVKETEDICSRSSICHWLSGEDADCEWGPGYDDHDPGCCTVSDVKNPQSYLWEDRCRELWNAKDCLEPLDDHSNERCQWTATDGDYDCSALWPTTYAPDEPGCCVVDESQNPDGPWASKCALIWNERDCLIPMDGAYQYRCSWIPTDYAVDCTELNPTPSPVNMVTPSPVDPYPIDTPSPVDPYPIVTPSPVDAYPVDTPSPVDAYPVDTPAPVDPYPINTPNPTQPTMFPTHPTPEPTKKPDNREKEEDGCCAADCEEELAMCNAIDDGDKCQKLSSCHWKPGKKADCSWKPNNDEPQDPGCCVAKSDQVDSEWFDKCPQFWNSEKCGKKDKNCRWVDCEEEEDCTRYWPQLQFEGHAEVALFEEIMMAEHSEKLGEGTASSVSLITVLMLFVAAFAMHKAYRWCWGHNDGNGYQKLEDYKWEREQQATSQRYYCESM